MLEIFSLIWCRKSQSTHAPFHANITRHITLIVSHEIVEHNIQTPLTRSNKLPHWVHRLALIPFAITHSQSCKYYLLWAQKALMTLKHVYVVKRSPYIYRTRNLFPYLMWDITHPLQNPILITKTSHSSY